LDERQDLRECHSFVIVVNAEFGMSEVAANVNVRYAGARLDQLLELLRSAELVGLAGNDKAQLELACMTAGFGRARAGKPPGLRRMMVVMVVIMIVVIMVMIMFVMLIVIMIMLATGAMNMFFVFRFRHENL
jgi:hypothetical protein